MDTAEYEQCVKRMRTMSAARNEAVAQYKAVREKHEPLMREYGMLVLTAERLKNMAEVKENQQVQKLEEFIEAHKDEIKEIFTKQRESPVGCPPIPLAGLTKTRIARYALSRECTVYYRICNDVQGVIRRVRDGQGFQVKLFQKVLLTGKILGCDSRLTIFADPRDADAVAKSIRAFYMSKLAAGGGKEGGKEEQKVEAEAVAVVPTTA